MSGAQQPPRDQELPTMTETSNRETRLNTAFV